MGGVGCGGGRGVRDALEWWERRRQTAHATQLAAHLPGTMMDVLSILAFVIIASFFKSGCALVRETMRSKKKELQPQEKAHTKKNAAFQALAPLPRSRPPVLLAGAVLCAPGRFRAWTCPVLQ